MSSEKTFVTEDLIEEAEKVLKDSKLVYETPILCDLDHLFNLRENVSLYLKLELLQTNGSFKIRGVYNQFKNAGLEKLDRSNLKLVTFSAGNYGKAFSYLCKMLNYKGKVILPDSATESRINFIKSQGVEAEKVPGPKLLEAVDEHVKNGWKLFHPLDDLYLIAGYSPIAKEILKIVDPDITVVCCGGGSLLAGISTGLALNGSKSRIFGVEPETANTMKESFEKGYAVKNPMSKSIATGLAPPMCGTIAYEHCKKYVEEIVLVSDEEIVDTCKKLFEIGIKVEPSGCAALAAVINNKITDINQSDRQLKVMVILSGGNISLEELNRIF